MEYSFGLSDAPLRGLSKTPQAELDGDLASSSAIMESGRKGEGFSRALLAGSDARQRMTDPLMDLKRMQLQSQIDENAAQAANYTRQLREKQIETAAEQRDRNGLLEIGIKFKGKPVEALAALSEFTPESTYGLHTASAQVSAISKLQSLSTVTKMKAKMSAVALASVAEFEEGSREWFQAGAAAIEKENQAKQDMKTEGAMAIEGVKQGGRLEFLDAQTAAKIESDATKFANDVTKIGINDVNTIKKLYIQTVMQSGLNQEKFAQADKSQAQAFANQKELAEMRNQWSIEAIERGEVNKEKLMQKKAFWDSISTVQKNAIDDFEGRVKEDRKHVSDLRKAGSDDKLILKAETQLLITSRAYQNFLLGTLPESRSTTPSGEQPAATNSAAPGGAPESTNEVIKVAPNGKRAVFDADTKKFLRYAD